MCKLPRSGAVAFRIRIHRTRLERVLCPTAERAVPALPAKLHRAVTYLRDKEPLMFRYKSLPAIAEHVLAFLEQNDKGAAQLRAGQ